MIGEFNIDGVFVPAALTAAILAFLLTVVAKVVLRRARFYRLVWHAGLFDTGLFVVILWLVSVGTIGLTPYLQGARP